MTEGINEGEEEGQENVNVDPDREAKQREKDILEQNSWVNSRGGRFLSPRQLSI